MQAGGLSRCDYEGIIWEYVNQTESDFFYNEIFVGECYMDGGISISDGDVIVDAGSNIGLFSLFCLCRADNIKLYSVEPLPPLFEVLQRNLKSYMKRNQITLVKAGLGEKHQDEVEFHYVGSAPGESTRYLMERNTQQDILRSSMKMQLSSPTETALQSLESPQCERQKRKACIEELDTSDETGALAPPDASCSSCGEGLAGGAVRQLLASAIEDAGDTSDSDDCTAYRCSLRTLPEIMTMGLNTEGQKADWVVDLLKVFMTFLLRVVGSPPS
jgi:FkbM family methyltransferase